MILQLHEAILPYSVELQIVLLPTDDIFPQEIFDKSVGLLYAHHYFNDQNQH
jgi:hypothetical protein